jgi:hypothetical protein
MRYLQPANFEQTVEKIRTPEQNLLFAVLFRACHDIVHYVQLNEHNDEKYIHAKTAREWLRGVIKKSQPNPNSSCYWVIEHIYESTEVEGRAFAVHRFASEPLIKKPNSAPKIVSEATLLCKIWASGKGLELGEGSVQESPDLETEIAPVLALLG